MVHAHLDNVVGHLRRLADPGHSHQPSDPSLLKRFVEQNDEAAFRILLERHGPTVLRVCRGVLHGGPDAEDAFQATFLIRWLSPPMGSCSPRRARTIRCGCGTWPGCKERCRARPEHVPGESVRLATLRRTVAARRFCEALLNGHSHQQRV